MLTEKKERGKRITLPDPSFAFKSGSRNPIQENNRGSRIKKLLNPKAPLIAKSFSLQHFHYERIIHFIKSLFKIKLEGNHLPF
jgi:hypothetical protein